MVVKEKNQLPDKKLSTIRFSGKDLRIALTKKFSKAITDRILSIFGKQIGAINLNCMQYAQYTECLQTNFMKLCKVTENLAVPRYFKLYYQLLMQGKKNYICEHDVFVFI